MPKTGWMAAYPRLAKPKTDLLHQQLQSTLSDIRTASVLGALTQPPAPQGVQKAVEEYTEKVVKDALEGRTGGGSDPILERLAKKVDTLAAAKAIKVLADEGPTTPTPTSTSEVVEAAKAMSQIYHDSAQMALEERDRAMAEKEAVENGVGEAMARARQEEADKYALILKVINQGWETQIEAIKSLSTMQIDLVKTQAQQQVDLLKSQHERTLEDIKGMVAAALKAKEEQIAVIKQAAEHEKELLTIKHQHELATKELEHKSILAQTQAQNLPPWEVRYREGMAEVLVDRERRKMEDEHNKALADQGFKDSLADLVKELKPALAQVAGFFSGGGRPPIKNGIPSTPPAGPGVPPAGGSVMPAPPSVASGPASPPAGASSAPAPAPVTDFLSVQRRQRAYAGMD